MIGQLLALQGGFELRKVTCVKGRILSICDGVARDDKHCPAHAAILVELIQPVGADIIDIRYSDSRDFEKASTSI